MRCKFCLKKHPFIQGSCPAWGKNCRDCGIMNHFSNSSVCQKTKSKFSIIEQFPSVFKGTIKGDPIHTTVQENAIPYHIGAPRRVAFPLLELLKLELERIKEMGVIKIVNQPTDWCHPIVVLKKPNGKLRICIDLTQLNKDTKREFYELPSVDDTLVQLGNGCKYMAKLDANSGYWQLPMDAESQLKCTFTKPFGRFCPTRGPFGLTSLLEIFNRKMDHVIEGLKGVVKSMDDFLVFGNTENDYNENLVELLSRLAEHGVTLNLEKCLFNQTEVEFLGHKTSAEGVRPLTKKVEAIQNFPRPTKITALRSFLGMAQQLSKFNPSLAKVAQPLRNLFISKSAWFWTDNHSKAFNDVKNSLTKPPILAHYDVKKPVKVRTDGSLLNGLSVVVYQGHDGVYKPIYCASRFLTMTEKNYYLIEMEMLAVAWGCTRMSKYLYGLPNFILETDHKPLISILITVHLLRCLQEFNA